MNKLDRYTKIEAERISKNTAEEEKYRIEQIGQESEIKGARLASEDFKRREKEDQKFTEESFGKLELFKKKGRKYYNRFLRLLVSRFIQDEVIPEKYTFWMKADDVGVSLGIVGTNFYGAFKPCGIENKDFMACKILAIKVGNTIAKLEGNYRVSEGGVAIPDEIDLKKYGHTKPSQKTN